MINNKPIRLIEVKWSDDSWSKSFAQFLEIFSDVPKTQLVGEIKKERTRDHSSEIRSAASWLVLLNLKGG